MAYLENSKAIRASLIDDYTLGVWRVDPCKLFYKQYRRILYATILFRFVQGHKNKNLVTRQDTNPNFSFLDILKYDIISPGTWYE